MAETKNTGTINFKDFSFDPDNFTESQYEKKTAKNDASIVYHQQPLQYEYVDENGRNVVLKKVKVVGPELTTSRGINLKTFEDKPGNVQASIFVVFDTSNEDQKYFVGEEMPISKYMDTETTEEEKTKGGFMTRHWLEMIARTWKQAYPGKDGKGKKIKGNLLLKQGEDEIAQFQGICTKVLYRSKDDPSTSKFFPLLMYTDPVSGKTNRASFFMPSNEAKEGQITVDWELLQGASFKFRPVISLDSYYFGGNKVSLQLKITSAVITSPVVKAETRNEQAGLIEELRMNKEYVSTLEQSLKDLKGMKTGEASKAPVKAITQGKEEAHTEEGEETTEETTIKQDEVSVKATTARPTVTSLKKAAAPVKAVKPVKKQPVELNE